MRFISILIVLIIIHFSAQAQEEHDYELFASTEFTIGNYYGLDLGLNFAIDNSYAFRLAYSGHVRRAKARPNDYEPGALNWLALGLLDPHDHIHNYQLVAGKLIPFKSNDEIRLNLSGGFGYTIISEPVNWELSLNGGLAGNYSFEYEKKPGVSLIVNPKIEFLFDGLAGLTVSTMFQLSKD